MKTIKKNSAPDVTAIDSADEIPKFSSEEEEATWWDRHVFSEKFYADNPAIPDEETGLPSPRSRPVAIRFDNDTLARLKALARKKNKGYQTMLKEFVSERLYEEEKREGIIS